MMCNVIKLSIVVMVLGCLSASADVVDVYAAADTWIEDGSEINHNGDSYLSIREANATQNLRGGLISWDLASLAGATINSVEMHFYTTFASETFYPHAYRVTSAWDETAATWTRRTATEDWGSAGVDYSDDVCTLVWNVYTGKYKPVIEGGTNSNFDALVQDWVDSPSSNFGIYVRRPLAATVGRSGAISSKEGGNAAYLKIDYIPIPEPLSILLLTAGALCLRRRKLQK